MHKKLLHRNGKVTTKSQIPKAASNASPREGHYQENMLKSMLNGSNYLERHLDLQWRYKAISTLYSSISNPEIRVVAILSFQYNKI